MPLTGIFKFIVLNARTIGGVAMMKLVQVRIVRRAGTGLSKKYKKKIPYHPFIFFQVQIVPSLFINLHFTLTAFRIFRILSPSPSLVRHFSLVKEKSETKLSRWLDTPDQYTALPSRDHCTKLALAGGDRSTGDCTTKKKHMATQKYRTVDRLCFHILILIP